MSEQADRSPLVQKFLAMPLRGRQIAFMYLGYSGVVVRLAEAIVGMDVANLLMTKELTHFGNVDLLLFTHSHWDHYDPQTAARILKSSRAQVVAQQQVIDDLKKHVASDRLIAAKPETPLTVGQFEILAVDGVHPRPISIFQIKHGELSIFHGGDSGYVPVEKCTADLAFLPTGSPSPSCSPENALRFALDLSPKVIVTMHGRPNQMKKLKNLVERRMPSTSVIIPEEYTPQQLTL